MFVVFADQARTANIKTANLILHACMQQKGPNSTKIKSAKTFLKAFMRKFIPSKYPAIQYLFLPACMHSITVLIVLNLNLYYAVYDNLFQNPMGDGVSVRCEEVIGKHNHCLRVLDLHDTRLSTPALTSVRETPTHHTHTHTHTTLAHTHHTHTTHTPHHTHAHTTHVCPHRNLVVYVRHTHTHTTHTTHTHTHTHNHLLTAHTHTHCSYLR